MGSSVKPFERWVLFFAVLACLLLFFSAPFLQHSEELDGRGVALNSTGVYLIPSPSSGTITEYYVNEGEKVLKGDHLAKFNNPLLLSILDSIETSKYKKDRLENQSQLLKRAFKINVGLFKQGLISKLEVDQARSSYIEKLIEIQETKAELSTLFAKLEQNAFVGDSFPHYRKLLEAPAGVIEFSTILDELSILRAPEDGNVLEILINKGKETKPGESVFWVERPQPPNQPKLFFVTMNAETKGQVFVGQKVLIEPSSINTEKYGAIVGMVIRVYPYPVSKGELLQSVANQQIVDYLLKGDEVKAQITVMPVVDTSTKTGYLWTKSEGPPHAIPSGTISKIRIILNEKAPKSTNKMGSRTAVHFDL